MPFRRGARRSPQAAARRQATPAATHQALAVGGEPAEQVGELEQLREVHGGAGAGRGQRGAAAPPFKPARSARRRPGPSGRKGRERRGRVANGSAREGGAPRSMPGAVVRGRGRAAVPAAAGSAREGTAAGRSLRCK